MRINDLASSIALLLHLPASLCSPGLIKTAPLLGEPCGASLGDCAGALHCVPLSTNCTSFKNCPGQCEDLHSASQQTYTACGGWGLYDDCNECTERCIADPRSNGCGPSCDDKGICFDYREQCKDDDECPDGKACFGSSKDAWGDCFPLRFGSDEYEKSLDWEVRRTDQDGWQCEDQADG